MQLNEKILTLYPELGEIPYNPLINPPYLIQDDGFGAYIKEWNIDLPRPTSEQLADIN